MLSVQFYNFLFTLEKGNLKFLLNFIQSWILSLKIVTHELLGDFDTFQETHLYTAYLSSIKKELINMYVTE